MRPGLSGWSQVNYPYGPSAEDSSNKLSFDLYYISNFSILIDFHVFSMILIDFNGFYLFLIAFGCLVWLFLICFLYTCDLEPMVFRP